MKKKFLLRGLVFLNLFLLPGGGALAEDRVRFTYKTSECKTGKSPDCCWKPEGQASERCGIDIQGVGRVAKFTQLACRNCEGTSRKLTGTGRVLEIEERSKVGHVVIQGQRYQLDGVGCMCTYQTDGTLENLSPGEYKLSLVSYNHKDQEHSRQTYSFVVADGSAEKIEFKLMLPDQD